MRELSQPLTGRMPADDRFAVQRLLLAACVYQQTAGEIIGALWQATYVHTTTSNRVPSISWSTSLCIVLSISDAQRATLPVQTRPSSALSPLTAACCLFGLVHASKQTPPGRLICAMPIHLDLTRAPSPKLDFPIQTSWRGAP